MALVLKFNEFGEGASGGNVAISNGKLVENSNERPIQQYNGTWIYGMVNFSTSGFENYPKHVLFHTMDDYNNMEAVNKTFPPFSNKKHIKNIDFMFNIDDLCIIEVNSIWIVKLSHWTIIPENVAKTLVPEMKKWNEDTIKRSKIGGIFRSSLESVGKEVPYRLQK